MEFIPYQRLTIITALSKDEVTRRIKERVGPRKHKNFARVDNNIFSGSLVNDRFDLTLNKDYNNAWTPGITGTVTETNNFTVLTLQLKSSLFVIIFTALFITFGMFVLITSIRNLDSKGFDWGSLMFVLFPYGLMVFGFNYDADRSIDGLIKLTKGEIE